jgi:hypothetical protein
MNTPLTIHGPASFADHAAATADTQITIAPVAIMRTLRIHPAARIFSTPECSGQSLQNTGTRSDAAIHSPLETASLNPLLQQQRTTRHF